MRRIINFLFLAACIVYGGWLALYWFQQPEDAGFNSTSSQLDKCLAEARGSSAKRACRAEWGRGLIAAQDADQPVDDPFSPSRMATFAVMLIVPAAAVYGIGLLVVKFTTRLRPPSAEE